MNARFSQIPGAVLGVIVFAVLFIVAPLVSAAAPASDDANASVYSDGWATGDDGGTGLGAWTLGTTSGTGSENGHFIGDCDVAVNDKCWGMYANNNQTASAVRAFDTSMNVNETFVIFMDNSSIDTGKTVGFGLRNGSGQNLMEFYFEGGDSNYTIWDNAGVVDSGVAFTDQGLKIEVSLTTSGTYDVRITRLVNNAQTTLSNRSLANPSEGQSIADLRLFNFSAGNGSSHDAFFNSILIRTGTLAVTLAEFSAQQVADHVRVAWETVSELDNRGFNLYRGTDPAGPDRQLNATLIPSQSQGSPGGFVYTWDDYADLVPGTTYYYWLEDVAISGATTLHGPVSVDFVAPTAVTLGSVAANPAAALPALPWLWVVAGAGVALALGRRR